jgi:hypothetical protein
LEYSDLIKGGVAMQGDIIETQVKLMPQLTFYVHSYESGLNVLLEKQISKLEDTFQLQDMMLLFKNR